MAHDVFISHSANDKPIADAVCAALEHGAIRCWIAPRDVRPGRSFAGEITRAIQKSKAMVLIFSGHSNSSGQVLREVQLAVESHLHIVQFRIEDVLPNDDLKYFLGAPHWLDALKPPVENHIARLKTSINSLLDSPAEDGGETASAFTSTEKNTEEVAVPPKLAPSSASKSRVWIVSAMVVTVLALMAWFGVSQPRRHAIHRDTREIPVPSPAVVPTQEPTTLPPALQRIAERNAAAGERFLSENRKRDGVIITSSGLQYKVLKEGAGASPKETDTVVAHYQGTLIDGTEFESTYKRGEAVTLSLSRVIKGWAEALQLMKVGSKYRLFIPPSLAYGERGSGTNIGPNSTLVFDVELLSITPK
jgi:hypothetical protein